MPEFKLVISNPKDGKSYQKDIKDDTARALIGKKIGDEFKGESIDMPGYEFKLTGGSDSAGFPMRADIEGTQRKQILSGTGVGVTNKLRKPNPKKKGWRKIQGMRIRKTVAGNTVHAKTAQVNLKVLKEGKDKLGGAEAPAEGEAPKEEPAKEEPKAEKAPKEEVKEEPKKESKKEKKEDKKVEEETNKKEDVADHAEEAKDGAEIEAREIPEDQVVPIESDGSEPIGSGDESDAVEAASEAPAEEKKDEPKEEEKEKEEPAPAPEAPKEEEKKEDAPKEAPAEAPKEEDVDQDVAEAENIEKDIEKDEEEVKKADEEIAEVEKELAEEGEEKKEE